MVAGPLLKGLHMTAIALSPSAFLPRAALAAALAPFKRVVERRNTIPVLSNVLMRSDAAGVVIEGTDLDMMMRASIPAAIADDAFALTVPAHLALDLTKRAASDDVTITQGETAAFDFGGQFAQVQTLPVSDFPSLNFTGDVRADFMADADDFRAGLEAVAFAMSTEETRYYLCGVYLHTATLNDGSRVWRMVATDGHRLARHDVRGCSVPEGVDHGVILPSKAVTVLLDLLKPAYEGKGKAKVRTSPDHISITLNCAKARFVFGGYELVTKLVDGTFPDYGRCIPSSNDIRVTIDPDAFTAMIRRVSAMSSERGRAVRLDFDGGAIMASVRNPDAGDTSDMMTVDDHDGRPIEIGFNARYLLDVIDALTGPITIKMTDAGAPTVLVGSDPRTLVVLMPMRV
jgi:DNA polymerase III subunit beta